MGNGISGIPDATGGLKSMKLDFADPAQAAAATPQAAPQIPPGVGVPPAGMEQGAIMPAGLQGAEQPGSNPLLAGVGAPQQSPMDSSMLSDQDLMSMVGAEYDPVDQAGQQMFDQSMQDPSVQQQLMLAARRMMGGR